MVVQTGLGERLNSLPNTQIMTLLGGLILVVAVGMELSGMEVEAGLTATLGLFFALLGFLSYSLLWLLGVIESYRL